WTRSRRRLASWLRRLRTPRARARPAWTRPRPTGAATSCCATWALWSTPSAPTAVPPTPRTRSTSWSRTSRPTRPRTASICPRAGRLACHRRAARLSPATAPRSRPRPDPAGLAPAVWRPCGRAGASPALPAGVLSGGPGLAGGRALARLRRARRRAVPGPSVMPGVPPAASVMTGSRLMSDRLMGCRLMSHGGGRLVIPDLREQPPGEGLAPYHRRLAVRCLVVVAGQRHRGEADVAGPQAPQLAGQRRDVEALVHLDGRGHRVQHPPELERVAQRARAHRLAEHGGQQLLLVADPGQVGGGEGVPVAGELQRGDAVDVVGPGGHVQPAVGI